MNSIEELIKEYEKQLQTILYMFDVHDIKHIPEKPYQWQASAIVCFLKDLKNLPNELRAVNRNEQLKEFCTCGKEATINICDECIEKMIRRGA